MSFIDSFTVPCIDNDNFCELMPKENCVKYRDWAMGSCRKTCGLCPNNCFDVDPICSQFPSTQLCADKNWAFGSCRKTCGLCSATHRPRFFTIRSIMKGKEEASL
uniref:Uncharacterized protein n=1 Tax=Magallana gigas TaxID=29159 RepID=K1P6F7_MAGGI